MYPDNIIFGMDLYSILLLAGCLAAIIYLRVMSGKVGMDNKVYNLSLLGGAVAILGGYFSSVLFQAVYNAFETGKFELAKDTGATFYGGLIGGAAIFLAIYFIAGHFTCKEKENIKQFTLLTDVAAGSIAIAHSLGRIGCLTAGCCYGRETHSWIGVWNEYLGYRTVPVQLFESIFLFGLFAFFTVRLIKKKTYNLSLYMILYGIWRFFIEYLRDDDRGETALRILTPSQLTAVLMVVGGALLLYFTCRNIRKNKKETTETTETKEVPAENE